MTNEELAVIAQGGDKQAAAELWEQVKPFCMGKAWKHYVSFGSDRAITHGVTLEDLQQESYIAFTEAVRGYKRDSGYKFITFLHFPLKNSFNGLYRLRRLDPLNIADSLDKEIPGAEGLTQADSLEDEQAQGPFDSFHDTVYTEQLHNALYAAMNETCTERQREILNGRYYNKQSLKELGEHFGINLSYIRVEESKALQNLRKPKAAKLLESFHDEVIGWHAYSFSTSFGAWDSKGSNPERVVEHMETYRK